MLVGRTEELALIEGALEHARQGRSSALMLRGEAGVGKTALLDYARGAADGALLLSARGIESESEIAFSGLLDLFRPVSHLIDSLPEPQAAALSSALALGPPAPTERFTIYAAALGLLAAAAESTPVVVLADDAQWLDPPSLEALLFAGRRLEAEGVAILLSVREGERDIDAAGLEEVTVRGLDEGSAAVLLRRLASSIVAPVSDLLVRETVGNPLALTEIVGVLTPDQLAGRRAIELPLPIGPKLERVLLERVKALPEATQDALLVASASDTGDMEEITRALKQAAIEIQHLHAAELAGVVAIVDGRVEFGHPLTRSALYHQAPLPRRRAAHALLAEAVSGFERQTWQRAAAADAADEDVAAALDRVATDAESRGGFAAAAVAHEKAARLTPGDAERSRRLLAAASSSHLAGRSGLALELVKEALAFATDLELRARIQHLRGSVLLVSGDPSFAADLLRHEADLVSESAPDAAVVMLMESSFAYEFTSRVADGERTALAAYELAPEGPLKAMAALNLFGAQVLSGDLGAAAALLEDHIGVLEHVPPPEAWRLKAFVGQAAGWSGRYDLAESLTNAAIVDARIAGAPSPLPYGLAVACELHYRMGDWTRSYAEGTEGIRLGLETGQEAMAACNMITIGRIYAARGQEAEAREIADAARDITERLGTRSLRTYIASLLGLLELGRGDARAALVHLDLARSVAHESALQNPEVVHFWGDLVDACVAAGDASGARKVTETLAEHARSGATPLTRALSHRCEALMADDGESDFETALGWHDKAWNPFEAARTRLAYGEHLRRKNQRARARDHLHIAADTFAALGARPWLDRAEAALTAAGDRPRRASDAGSARLTPQELQVALEVARGATNREAASALFLSPKTIEFHLSNVYAKLGIRSRSELAARVARGEVGAY